MNPLTKQEVKNVIEGKRTTERIPNFCSYYVWLSQIRDGEKQKG